MKEENQSGGFVITLALLISGAVAAGEAMALGGLSALGGVAVNAIADSIKTKESQAKVTHLLKTKLDKALKMRKEAQKAQEGSGVLENRMAAALKQVRLTRADLPASLMEKMKKMLPILNKNPSAIGLKKGIEMLKPHVKKIVVDKVKQKLGGKSGSGCGCVPKSGGTAKNAWLRHVMTYSAEHPGISYRQAMSDAKATYKK